MNANLVRVFISYRRSDVPEQAIAIWEALAKRLTTEQVFLDSAIQPGEDFVDRIEVAVDACELCLVVVGRRWLSDGAAAAHRLDDPNDWVRREIEIALHRGTPVVPVLVGGATIPSAHDLPASLERFVRREAIDLRNDSPGEIDRLVRAVERILNDRPALESEFGSPPPATADNLSSLRTALDAFIPQKRIGPAENFLLCTWNIRALGALTRKWRSGPKDSPKRDLTDVYCIAEIISRFHIVVIAEVGAATVALQYVKKSLGHEWSLMFSEMGGTLATGGERRAFLFDRRRVGPGGLADAIFPPEKVLLRRFARSLFVDAPYAITFESGIGSFTFVTVHPLLGKRAADRITEIRAFFDWLAAWARDLAGSRNDVFVLGDFNIDRRDDPIVAAALAAGITPILEPAGIPRMLDAPRRTSFHDQIAYFAKNGEPLLATEVRAAGGFDFTEPLLAEGMTRLELSWRLSDHFPLWAEFG